MLALVTLKSDVQVSLMKFDFQQGIRIWNENTTEQFSDGIATRTRSYATLSFNRSKHGYIFPMYDAENSSHQKSGYFNLKMSN